MYTLTTDDLLRPFFYTDRSLLKLLLQVAAQAVREVLEGLYPDVRIGMVYTVHTFGRDLGFKPHVCSSGHHQRRFKKKYLGGDR